MPQGPAHLHRRFGDDWTAWCYLKRRGYTNPKFVITPPWQGHTPTPGEHDAVTYLVYEWDWSYDPSGAPEWPIPASPLSQARRWLSRVSSVPLRVTDKYLGRWQMWWVCVARYELRKRWYYVTGRRKEWDRGEEVSIWELDPRG